MLFIATSFTYGTAAAAPGRLGWAEGKAATTSEATTVREFSVPASFEVGEHDNIVSSVYSHERDDPDHVIFQRLVDGAVDGRDGSRGGKPDPFGRTGLDRRGGQAR